MIEINDETISSLSNECKLPRSFIAATLFMKIGKLLQSEFQAENCFYRIKEDGKLYECICNTEILVDSPKSCEILGKWKIFTQKDTL